MEQLSDSNLVASAARLSERQKQCLILVSEGYTSKQIARALNLSPSTIDNHLRVAMERMGSNDRAAAARAFMARPEVMLSDRVVLTEGSNVAAEQGRTTFLPPFGGRPNHLSQRRRFFHVVQIALLAIMGMSAAIVTIAGAVKLFKP